MQIGRNARVQNGPGGMLGSRRRASTDNGIKIGAQLRRRVQSGAITGEQAQRTARERQTLKAKFGADWRSKLPGGAGAFRQARQKLAENPNNPKLIALNKRLAGRRSQLLAVAQGSGQPRPGGRVNPRGRGLLNPLGESPARPRRRRVAPARRAY